MFGPGKHDEATVILGYLEAQLDAIRASAHGLTEEQARMTPCRSALSIGGLVKHATYVMEGRERERRQESAGYALDEAAFALFTGSFALDETESLEGALREFDEARAAYLSDVRSVAPDDDRTAPPAPWDGRYEPTPSVERFNLVHHVEELARHAGHADIIREEIDGASSPSLVMAVEGRPGNDFIQPWTPEGS